MARFKFSILSSCAKDSTGRDKTSYQIGKEEKTTKVLNGLPDNPTVKNPCGCKV